MVSVPLSYPVMLALYVTKILQLAFTASDAGQVLVSVKSGGPGARAILILPSGPVPVLVKVTVCCELVPKSWELKFKLLAGARVATPSEAPVPFNVMVVG